MLRKRKGGLTWSVLDLKPDCYGVALRLHATLELSPVMMNIRRYRPIHYARVLSKRRIKSRWSG